MPENTALVGSRGELAIILSKLSTFPEAKVSIEQYPTDSEIAATVLWQAFQLGDVKGKTIADLGAGTGILGLGTMLLGAKAAYLIESDKDALEVAKQNFKLLKSESSGDFMVFFHNLDIAGFKKPVDTVIMNPPFGTKTAHADRFFLQKAFEIAKVVYSFHKTSTQHFVHAFANDNHFRITHAWPFDFPLKATMKFHEKKIQRIRVTCYRLEREKQVLLTNQAEKG